MVSLLEEVPAMVAAPSPRVWLLNGFALHFEHIGAMTTQVPHGVQRLVAHLCLYRTGPRTLIAGHLWPDVPEEHAHGSLRSALWRLRRLAPGLVFTTGDCLSLADGVSVDIQEIHNWAVRVRNIHTEVEDVRVPEAVLRGDLLPGWYDDWVLLERERLRQIMLHSLELAAERLATAGCHAEALEAAYSAVRMEPLRESAHRTLVRTHLAEGNPTEALRAYEYFRTLLADELGVAPTPRMATLVADLNRLLGKGPDTCAARPFPPWSDQICIPRGLRIGGA